MINKYLLTKITQKFNTRFVDRCCCCCCQTLLNLFFIDFFNFVPLNVRLWHDQSNFWDPINARTFPTMTAKLRTKLLNYFWSLFMTMVCCRLYVCTLIENRSTKCKLISNNNFQDLSDIKQKRIDKCNGMASLRPIILCRQLQVVSFNNRSNFFFGLLSILFKIFDTYICILIPIPVLW